jgi:hypothetical protein
MTGQLQSSLQSRADALDAWDVDLETIVRTGDRRIRRRRTALAGTVAGVLAVVGGATLAARGHATHPQPADPDAKPLTYAVGNVIHSGDATVDVGVHVESLVRTTRGFVFTDQQQRVYEEKDGDVRLLRSFDNEPAHLADADSPLDVSDDGRVTAWWDGERIQTYPGYVLDGKTDPISAARTWSNDTPPAVRAISGGHLYFWDGRRNMIAEVQPPQSTAFWPDSGLSDPQVVQDAAGNRLLVRVGDGLAVVRANLLPRDAGAQADWKPGTDLSGVKPAVPDVATGDLAPDARHWFTTQGGRFTVYDSADGRAQEPEHPGFAEVTPYQWLSGDSIAALAHISGAPDGSASILTCRVSTNACAVVASGVGDVQDVVLAGDSNR